MSRSSHAGEAVAMPEDGQHELMAATLANPVRSRILLAAAGANFFVAIGTANGGEAGVSVRQIAERVQESRRRVRYHLEVLCRQGLVEIVEERRRRGVVEHYYRAVGIPMFSKEEMEGMPVRRQQKIILATLREIFADATAALESGTFVRRPEWTTARLHADVDEQGWAELGVIYEKTTRDALEIIAAAQERLQGTDEQPIRVGAASLLFEAANRTDGASDPEP